MDTTFLTLGLTLLVAGFLLVLADLFIASGILLVLAVGSIGVGLVFLFKYDSLAGIYGLVGIALAIPAFGYLLVRLLPSTPLGKMGRQAQEQIAEGVPHHLELQNLKGHLGRAMTALRPAGMVEFGGRRVDCLTEGMMIDAGQMVRCIDVQGANVIVRLVVDSPSVDLESDSFK